MALSGETVELSALMAVWCFFNWPKHAFSCWSCVWYINQDMWSLYMWVHLTSNMIRINSVDPNLGLGLELAVWEPSMNLHPPAGILCGGPVQQCWCNPCCVWRWCSTWWRRAAGCRTHTACPGPSRRRRGYGPAARRRCRPAGRPWAGSAAGTAPWEERVKRAVEKRVQGGHIKGKGDISM